MRWDEVHKAKPKLCGQSVFWLQCPPIAVTSAIVHASEVRALMHHALMTAIWTIARYFYTILHWERVRIKRSEPSCTQINTSRSP